MTFQSINPSETSIPAFHQLMLGSIAPRPIAFVSTIDRAGRPNLSPYSFFNAFGANPPVVVFSPSRRGKDNTTKDTYENVKEVPEVVINMVSFAMAQQMNEASAEFPRGVNEFEKAGFTMLPSELVRPFRVAESPVHMECRVLQVIETGHMNAEGNLVICEILRVHVNPEILDPRGRIDPHKIDLIGRLGSDYYVRASGSALFEMAKPQG